MLRSQDEPKSIRLTTRTMAIASAPALAEIAASQCVVEVQAECDAVILKAEG